MNEQYLNLMTAKICHDMATPLSAMNLLLEFAFEHCKDPHIELTFRESLDKLSLRLQFYRLLLTNNKESPSYPDVFSVLTYCAKILKVKIDLPVECPDGSASRLLLGLTYLMMEALTHGGTVSVSLSADDKLILKAEGHPLHFRPGCLEALENPQKVEVNARNVLPVYLAQLATSLRVSVHVQELTNEYAVIETITLPYLV